MREIKFRAWDKFKNEMVVNPKLNYQGTINKYFTDCADQYWEWMQYTGLKDKNGKEIYEGDLIRVTSTPGKDAFGDKLPDTNSIAKVFFKDGAFQTDFYNSLLRIALPGNWQVEVIGNIYQDSQLLK